MKRLDPFKEGETEIAEKKKWKRHCLSRQVTPIPIEISFIFLPAAVLFQEQVIHVEITFICYLIIIIIIVN